MGLTKGRIGGSGGGIRMLCFARRRRRRAFSCRSREHSASADSNETGGKVLQVISTQNSSKDWQLAKGQQKNLSSRHWLSNSHGFVLNPAA